MSSSEPRGEGSARPLASPSLRAVAREAIEYRLRQGREPETDLSLYPPHLHEPRATFVTLRRHGELRGCTGSLEATRPLVADVVHNACRSAFGDPRFPPLSEAELVGLAISVSLLSPLERLRVASEQELLGALRPGIDGLVLSDAGACATFLPSVWESLPEPPAFLDALRRKAGLPPGHWSETIRFERYTVTDAP
jgi:AmmeMemoRadiSam system protein A